MGTHTVAAAPALAAGPWPFDVGGRLAALAAADPDRPALRGDGRTVSYADLCRHARRVAAATRGPAGAPLAALLPQTVAGLADLVGALAGDRPVVLLDPLLPADRLRVVADHAGVRDCLTDAALRPLAVAADLRPVVLPPTPDTPAGGRGSNVPVDGSDPGRATGGQRLDPPTGETIPQHHTALCGPADPAADPFRPPAPDRTACVVFTSGSTGRPKGVTVSHAMLCNEAYGARERLGIGPGDRVALVLPVAFMAGLTVLAFGLLNGATVCPADPRAAGVRHLPDWLAATDVNTLHCTPSLLRSLLAVLPPRRRLPGLRLVTTCGEAVHGRDVAALRPHLDPAAVFTSWSGSSEIGHLAFWPVAAGDPLPEGIVPVGRPAPGKQVTVVGPDGAPVPAGATGEVVVTSAYLASGYWAEPERTAARFRPLPDGRTAYRTGDLGRFDADGVLHLRGRLDSAVKIRGYLVEPAEVEAALLACPPVAEAAVTAVRRPGAAAVLAGYVSPRPGQPTPTPAGLRRQLADRLPSWMVPTSITVLPRLPRTERGKVDRAALPPPAVPVDGPAPRSHWEVVVADLWAQVLELDRVPTDADFLDLGGDSLAAEELLAAVAQRFGVALDAADLAANPTVARFAARVADDTRRREGRSDVTVLRDGAGPPLWCVAGAGGLGFGFLPLARRLADRPVYALQAHGLERRGRPDWTVAAAARRHVREIVARQPEGPYTLVGHSLGGLIALAAAQLLRARGADVPLVTLLDTYLPDQAAAMPYAGPAADGGHARPVDAAADAPGRLRRVAASVRALAGDSRELWSYRLRLPLAGLVPFDGITQYGVFFQQGHLVTRLHRPRPWDGPTLLLLAADNPAGEPRWRQLLTGPLRVRRLDCDHPSILREPHVAAVAEAIAAQAVAP